jgi:L,D-transpeptidase YbiS
MFNLMNDPDPTFLHASDRAHKAGWPGSAPLIAVSITTQSAALLLPPGPWHGPWPVSTAAAGTGNTPGSNRTPTGLHRVCDRIGDGAPQGAEFSSRLPTGRVIQPGADGRADDLILTRILWLDGLQPGVNEHSRARFIYLHGTNREDLLGTPASHGCVRMANADILHLFDLLAPHPDVYCWME